MTEEDLKERVWAALDSVIDMDTTLDDYAVAVARDLLPMVQAAEKLATRFDTTLRLLGGGTEEDRAALAAWEKAVK